MKPTYNTELCGDNQLSRMNQIKYLFLNGIRACCGWHPIAHSSIFFHPQDLTPNDSNTPTRQYINAFLQQEFPKHVFKNRNTTFLDIGCGTGYILKTLSKNGYTGSYTGIDVFDYFKQHTEKGFHVSFVKTGIEDFTPSEKYMCIISNTALEHIKNDEHAIKKATELLADDGVQIHIVPSAWSLPLYLLHGYRQYSPRDIHRLFSNTPFTYYRLGGAASFFLHFFYITIPERLGTSFRKKQIYSKLVRTAHTIDRFLPVFSSMYIIISRKKSNSNYHTKEANRDV